MTIAESRIGSIRFDALTMPDAVAAICRLARQRPMAAVVTPNVDHLVLYHRNLPFRDAVDGAALRLADGQPIVWASRLTPRRLPGRVAGADLLAPVCEAAAKAGLRVFICGGADGVAERAATALRGRFAGLEVAGTLAPQRSQLDSPGTIEAINAARPDILFVAFGAPLQELWLERHRRELDVGVGIGVGAAIDFAVGVQSRAPEWMQRSGLEWLYRLSREPRRLWRRYLVRDPLAAWYILADLARPRPRRRHG